MFDIISGQRMVIYATVIVVGEGHTMVGWSVQRWDEGAGRPRIANVASIDITMTR